ncbi:hypothetical protein L596_015207 [Steinernema carpocapsae]|uniref:Protein artemis n=1 Tax=Steinernema carpocapsae TaxID=34508 RepID=A0A4U5NFL1_STECR|nr:hypothetical protein L596_015207 [Steinernema carpocapsae]
MILFEFSYGATALYTGDFRLTKEDWNSFAALRVSREQATLKRIDALYFDSTFCTEESRRILPRDDCKLFTILTIKWWLAQTKSKVLIWSYGSYGHEFGHEFMLRSIWKELKMKIHVTEDRMKTYESCGRRFSEFATTDPSATRVHACVYWDHGEESEKPSSKQVLGCPGCPSEDKNVMVIKLSMKWFKMQQAAMNLENPLVRVTERRFTRIQYSCHSSLSEVEDAFRILRPRRADPNVV